MASQLRISALLALCLVSAVVARDSIFMVSESEPTARTETVAIWNEQLDSFDFVNQTVEAPRRSLKLGDKTKVSVTFYNSPGMDCTSGEGMCGFGSDVTGRAMGGGGAFLETSLSPYHAASGNFDVLGSCGACGTLRYRGKARSFVITDTTDHKDDIGGDGYHIDLCLPSFNWFTDGDAGDGSHGGIFTGEWERVDCSTIGAPDYPDSAIVVRTQAYNQWAKAVVISRLRGVGEISSVNFVTRNGGFVSGARVNGWGAWWMPTRGMGGLGGVNLQITLKDGTSVKTSGFPLPDSDVWGTGNVYNVYADDNVQKS